MYERGKQMEKISLNGKWELFYYDAGKMSVKTPDELEKSGADRITATVPGNVELDLSAAEILPSDLYKGFNIEQAYKYEGYDWWYKTEFSAPDEPGEILLHFDGVDCFASYWLNGELIGKSENAVIAHEFNVTGKLSENNTLYVHIKSAARKAYSDRSSVYSLTGTLNDNVQEGAATRKPPHAYGWDIMPRAVSAGIWKDVSLNVKSAYEFDQIFYWCKSVSPDKAVLKIAYDLDIPYGEELSFKFEAKCKNSRVDHGERLEFKAGFFYAEIENPYIWWPKGYGEPNLYEASFSIVKEGKIVNTYGFNIGIRTVDLIRTLSTDGENGEFVFIVNGERIMCKGSNWVPMDAYHSRDRSRYARALELADDIGCNILRCWGGNVYEQEEFYDFCDSHGIMVWQDFMMACRAYPQDEAFKEAVRTEAEQVVKSLRNHPSIILWAGDNECDSSLLYANGRAESNVLTREVLPEVIRQHDLGRPYLASSPYIALCNTSENTLPEQHLWGARDYYKSRFYTEAAGHFVSETGYHGCPSRKSIEKFIDEEYIWPPENNGQWSLHSTDYHHSGHRVKLMADQIMQLFAFAPANLDDFALASQFSQAEAKKFFIERIRLGKPKKTGVIWWNLIDGWPQMSDAVVDYYYEKKIAYSYIKRSMTPFVIMAGEIDDWHSDIVASNDTLRRILGTYRVSDLETEKLLSEGSFSVDANENKTLCRIPVMYSDKGVFMIEWEIDGKKYFNHYLHGYPAFDFETYKKWYEKIEKYGE